MEASKLGLRDLVRSSPRKWTSGRVLKDDGSVAVEKGSKGGTAFKKREQKYLKTLKCGKA